MRSLPESQSVDVSAIPQGEMNAHNLPTLPGSAQQG